MIEQQARQAIAAYEAAWKDLEQRLSAPGQELGKLGQTIRRGFFFGLDTSYIADRLCTYEREWESLETVQDNSYFGVFVNQRERRIVTFAEGDLTVEIFPRGKFQLGLAAAHRYYDDLA